MTPEEAQRVIADYDKVVAFYTMEFPNGVIVNPLNNQRMSAKEFIDTQYLYDETQRKKLEEAKKILHNTEISIEGNKDG